MSILVYIENLNLINLINKMIVIFLKIEILKLES